MTDKDPDGLPGPAPAKAQERIPVSAFYCSECGKEARIISNHSGRRAVCAGCKKDWPISGPVSPIVPPTPGRGVSKKSLIPLDLSPLYDTDDEDGYGGQ